MSDDTSKRDFRDRDRINVNEIWEVEYWTKALHLTASELRELVRKHGVMVADVKKAIGR